VLFPGNGIAIDIDRETILDLIRIMDEVIYSRRSQNMKHRLFIISTLVVGMLFVMGCGINFGNIQFGDVQVVRGSGIVISESRDVSGFDRVQLDGLGELTITQGNTETLTIEAEDNILPRITTEVRNGTLVIGFGEDWETSVIPTKTIKFTMTVDDLTGLIINGAANADLPSLNTDQLNLEINGVGKINIANLTSGELILKGSGGADFGLSGTVTSQKIDVDGAANIQAGDLQSQNVEITINGLGNATLWVTDSLDATINGAGTIEYYGSPTVNPSITGAGNINSLGNK
jgi:hypothetical protein